MKYISTSQLRTKSKQLVNQLRDGESVTLLYRSKAVAEIVPRKDKESSQREYMKVSELLSQIRPSAHVPDDYDAAYRKAMEEKHG